MTTTETATGKEGNVCKENYKLDLRSVSFNMTLGHLTLGSN